MQGTAHLCRFFYVHLWYNDEVNNRLQESGKRMELKLFSKKSSAEHFERLAEENERKIYAVCFHMMGNHEDAQDCAQETMLRAFRAFSSFRRDAQFSTWASRIAMNVCTDALRKRKEIYSLDMMREEQGFDAADQSPGTYARLEEKERMRLLREGMALLPPEMRQMIVLRDVQGMSYDEVAEVLNLPLGTVKSRISRAREKLSAFLRKSSELFSSQSV